MFTIINNTKKKGRPCKFGESKNILIDKKNKLFESNNANSEYLSLVNLAHHCQKISNEEYEIALYLENLHNDVLKILEVKSIPKSTSHTWTVKNNFINSNLKNQEKSIKIWDKISYYLSKNDPLIFDEFFKLICSHHSYEELFALKTNQKVMQILKQGLKTIKEMFSLELI